MDNQIKGSIHANYNSRGGRGHHKESNAMQDDVAERQEEQMIFSADAQINQFTRAGLGAHIATLLVHDQ